MITLRPRQQKALTDLRQAYASGARAPILVAPTGFGKTATAAEVVRMTVARGKKVWFLAHLKEILDDTSARLRTAGIPHGHIRAGRHTNYSAMVQVVGVATAVRRQRLPKPDLIIIDECHLAVADSYKRVITATGNPLLLGLTGTAQRLDGRGLGEVFDRLVPTCSTAELIDEGLLAPVRVYAPPGIDLGGLRKRGGDYDQGQAGELLSKPAVVGDALSHWRKLCHRRRGVAFCTTVAHAQAVADQWRRAGYRAVAVHGGSEDRERREAVAGLRAGRLDLVACAQLWIAGVDVPEIDCVIWLRPTQSLTAWLQGNGRGLRIAPGKRDLLILDHVGNCGRLGHPLEVHEWSLEGRRKRDRETAPSVKVCPKCFATTMSTAQICRECGHVFAPQEARELKVVDGELVELTIKKNKIKCNDIVQVRCKWFGENGEHLKDTWLDGWKVYSIEEDGSSGKWLVASFNCVAPDGTKQNVLPCDIRLDSNAVKRREQGNAQSLQDLIALGHQRGYKNPAAWAKHVLAGRQNKAARA